MNSFDWWSEIPDARESRIWCYSKSMTYRAGDHVGLHISGSCSRYTVRITREGKREFHLGTWTKDNCRWTDVPENSFEVGCDWPVLFEFHIPPETLPGAYLIEVAGEGCAFPYHHLIFVLARETLARRGRIVLVAASNTYMAYNNWGGASHYGGLGADGNSPAPVLSVERPWGRGSNWLPQDAPRIADYQPRTRQPVRYPHLEWARERGFTRSYASAGWANYEKIFVNWAEQQGFDVDVVCQTKLHDDPSCLDGYACAVFVGHDEYWTWEMRDHVDAYVEGGGNVARFAGNFMWQTRLDRAANRQATFKYAARSLDPFYGTDRQHLTTTSWEAPEVGRPGASTFGVNATRGMYAGFGGVVARGPRGFTVYRHDHWMFEETGLGYGDLIGHEGRCFGYEVDGLDYVVEGGLPRPSGIESVPDGLTIIALGLSTPVETGAPSDSLYLGDSDGAFIGALYGELYGEAAGRAAALRGCGTIVEFTRGAGRVVTVGSCEWVAGLRGGDKTAERVTLNILARLST